MLRNTDLIAAVNAATNVDLRGQDLSGLDLSGANLQNADLRDSDLRGTHFGDANLQGANLSGAHLDGTTWTSPGGHPFNGTQIPQALFMQDHLNMLVEDIKAYRAGTITDDALDNRVRTGDLTVRASRTIRSGDLRAHYAVTYLEANPHLEPLIEDANRHLETHPGIVVYTQPGCQPCMATLRDLNKLGIAYTTINLREHPELAQALSASGIKEAPVVDAGAQRWSGYRPDHLRNLKHAHPSSKQAPTPTSITPSAPNEQTRTKAPRR